MKKIFASLLAVTGVFLSSRLYAGPTDIFTFNRKGSTEIALGCTSTGTIYATNALFNFSAVFFNPLASSSASLAAGGYSISTATLRNAASTYFAADITSQPLIVPRNIVIYSSPATNGIATTTLLGCATFYGVDALGNNVQEMIRFSTTMPLIGISSYVGMSGNPLYMGQGNVAFARISSFTIHLDSMTDSFGIHTANVLIFIGYGNKLGFANDITDPSDVYKVTENLTDTVLPAGAINAEYNTYYPTLPPNGSRTYQLWYKVKRSPFIGKARQVR